MQDNRIYKAIIRTLSYSDVFDYPLKKHELWKFLNIRTQVNKNSFNKALNQMIRARKIEAKNRHLFLIGRKKIVFERLKRERISIGKLEAAKKAANILSFIPTIKLIGISGSLSLKNAQIIDDIDFFIITTHKSLWITRFFVNVLLLLTGYKRSIHDLHGMNLVCPNLFLSEDNLLLSRLRRNLFSAREIAQLYLLLDRDSMYKKFLSANFWVKNYLANVKIPKSQPRADPPLAEKISLKKDTWERFLDSLDKIFYATQFLYMSNRITGEEIRRKAAYFHPQDKGKIILKIYKMRCEKYSKNILQDIDNKPPFLYI